MSSLEYTREEKAMSIDPESDGAIKFSGALDTHNLRWCLAGSCGPEEKRGPSRHFF